MSKINRPTELPDCKIVNTLIDKANIKSDYEFNYIHQLNEIRNKVSIEVSRINLLFPEYTPHDEKYHLKRLFYVADQLLGDQLIESMNVTELFLLSVSLYAHDWGMAISEEEKNYILFGKHESSEIDSNLLDGEKKMMKDFCKNKNIKLGDIKISDWQEYIRLTHAFRSGKRIKTYFDPISIGIADFASRICEGHYLDFDIIDDFVSYPTDCSIHRDVVNVKALTVYVRLIDLLDLGEDRTPFVLWKFVAPRNEFSKLEWAKHRALQPVTFPAYQYNRYIQIDGSTNDHNVYMSIMDLKKYIDIQFRQCADMLNRINHTYHKLNISHIDWRIAARGFEPVPIQFEFDRGRMFDILGDEIYQGNPFVFVRELLQNSIDALEMRVEILGKKGISIKPQIDINIIDKEEVYAIQITDNGIGMDEYIIRNYLTVAGKSYYKSIDFHREGLKMDPISRFGIGVLSCFMVADYIEIITYKDPHTTARSECLKISIPSKENYFRIEKSRELNNIGTTFMIYVQKSRLPRKDNSEESIEFNLTEYLKKTAGFVKYPIFITENKVMTVINSPNNSQLYSSEFSISNLNYSFPLEKAILPQNRETAIQYFVEKKIHLREDLKLSDFDGCITLLVPKSDSIDIINVGMSWPSADMKLIDYESEVIGENKIQTSDIWRRPYYSTKRDKVIIRDRSFYVYLNGILIEDISSPEVALRSPKLKGMRFRPHSIQNTFVAPQIIINIPKPKGMKIDLARTTIESMEKWDTPIWLAYVKYIKETFLAEIVQQLPKDRLLRLARLITFYQIPIDVLFNNLITYEYFPLPFITENSTVLFTEKKDSNIRLAPGAFNAEYNKYLAANYIISHKYEGPLDYFTGSPCVMGIYGASYLETLPASLCNLGNLVRAFIDKYYHLTSIEFLSSPKGISFPLAQEIYSINPVVQLMDYDDPLIEYELDNLDSYGISMLRTLFRQEFDSFPDIVLFSTPYQEKIFYGFEYLNINSSFIRCLIKICLSVIVAKRKESFPKEVIGRLIDLVKDIHFISYRYLDTKIKIEDLNHRISLLFTEAFRNGLIDDYTKLNLDIKFEDFIDNSIKMNNDTKTFYPHFSSQMLLRSKKKWGKTISTT